MFGLIPSLRRRRPSRQLTTHRRIQFESLESRYCLSAATITSFEIDSIDDRTVSLSGHVSDESPETVEVDFFGALTGSATPDASGYFAFSADADWLGEIGAVAYDDESLSSDSSFVEVTSDVPMIDSLSVEFGEGTEVTVTGQVIDDGPDGLSVELTGAVEGTAITDAGGYFTFTAAEGSGYVDVSVADAWGQNAEATVETGGEEPGDPTGEEPEDPTGEEPEDPTGEEPDGAAAAGPLEIMNFGTDIVNDGYISVWGNVSGEHWAQATIVLTFLDVEEELSADSGGDFFWYYQCDAGDEGWITVVASDDSNNESFTVEDYQGYI